MNKNLVIMIIALFALTSATHSVLNVLKSIVQKTFGKLSSTQLASIEAIYYEWQKIDGQDFNKLIYIIATCWHESRLKPIKEGRAKEGTKEYNIQNNYWYTGYFGRGLIQLTLRANYEKFGKILGIDIIKNPDLVLETKTAAFIAVIGMYKGLFRTYKLSDFINESKVDFFNARNIVNSKLDRADLIESYAINLKNNLDGQV